MSQQVKIVRRCNTVDDLYCVFDPCAVDNLLKLFRRVTEKKEMIMRYIRRGTICVQAYSGEFSSPPSKEEAVEYAHAAMPTPDVIYTQNTPFFQYGGKDRPMGSLYLYVNDGENDIFWEKEYAINDGDILYILS